MVRSRFAYVVVVACGALLAGCASGGGGGMGAGGADPGGGGGTRPRETGNTNTATFMLGRAMAEDEPAGFYRNALEAALSAVEEGRDNPLGYLLAGRAQIGLGQYLTADSMVMAYVAADSMLTVAEALYPAYLEETAIDRENAWINLFNAALDPLDAGDIDLGVSMLETAEVIFPRMRPEALHNLGVTYGNAGRFDEAVDAYGGVLAIVRSRIEEVDSATAASWRMREQNATFNRANILTRAERYDEAAATYGEYLESAPGDVQALTGLAGALASQGQADSAQVIYNSLLAGSELGVRQYVSIGVGLYQSAQAVDTMVVDPKPIFGRAATAFRLAADIAPDSRDAVYNMGQSFAEAEDWESLLPVTGRLLELDPYNPQTYLLRALALNGTGSQEEAITVYTQGDSLDFTLGYPLQAMTPRTGGGAVASVLLTNNSLDPGTSVEFRVHFIGEDGSEAGTVDVEVQAPDQGATVPFNADLTSEESVVGFYVEVLGPR